MKMTTWDFTDMKTKPFDLEEAKDGKPFRVLPKYGSYDSLPVFLAVSANGGIVYEYPAEPGGVLIYRRPTNELEMIVETVTTTVYLYWSKEFDRLFPTTQVVDVGNEFWKLVGQSVIEWEKEE